MNSTDELLKPRYLVIADYPKAPFDVNTVLIMESIEGKYWRYKWAERDGYAYMYSYEMDVFPHLFRKLEWWEMRKVEEMPEYVIFLKDVRGAKNGQVVKTCNSKDYFHDDDTGYLYYYAEGVLPATESEYTTYINNLNK